MRTTSREENVENPYGRLMATLSSHVISCLERHSGIMVPVRICTRDTLQVALPKVYEQFNENPKKFVRENRREIHKTISNMLKARGNIIQSMKDAVRESGHNRVVSKGMSARMCGYDMACSLLLTLLSRDRKYWIKINECLEAHEDDDDESLLKSWKKITSTPFHTQKYDNRPLEFGIEFL